MDSPYSGLIYFFIGLVVFIILFLALRALFLWYWKIDEIVENQSKIVHNQDQQIILLKALVRHHVGDVEYGKLFQSTTHLKPTNEEVAKAKSYDKQNR